MDLRQLRSFLAVAEHRHFTRAAAVRFVSQPALSQHILALERELGTPLFDRLSTGAELTTAGQVLRSYAERVLREMDNAKVAVEEVTGAVRGELSLSSVHTANLALVVEVLARFRERHPDVRVRLHEEPSAQVVESVLSGRVNLGIVYLPAVDGALETTPLYDEELVLVVPSGHRLAGGTVEPSELSDLPLIVPPDGLCLRAGIDGALDAAGAPARIVAEISAPESICEAVRANLGVTLLPLSYAERRAGMDGLEGLAWARIRPAVPARMVGAIRRADRHSCLATKAFLSALGDCAALSRGLDFPGERPARPLHGSAATRILKQSDG